MHRLFQALFGPVGAFHTPVTRRSVRALAFFLPLFLVLFTPPAVPRAHDVPYDVVVQLLVKPEGDRLRLLVRVPMVAMQDIDFPQHGPGYLNIPDAEPSLRQAAMSWIARELRVYENDVRLGGQQLTAVMASLPSDRSFADYDRALAHVTGPRLPDTTELVWQQTLLDTLFEYPIQSDRSRFSIEPTLGRLGQRTQTVLRFVLPDGGVRVFEYAANPGVVPLDPRWSQAALRFAVLGFEHLLDGIDHLLFLAVLVVPVRRLRSLVAVVLSFSVGHSVTLIASGFGFTPTALWFPALIDLLIAMSIAYVAIENMLGRAPTRRWLVTFAFGLVHGIGFSFALRETLQFAGGHVLTSLLAFNLGIEVAQWLVVGVLVISTAALFRFAFAERAGTILLSGLVAHTAWHWILERGDRFLQYDVRLSLPAFDALFLGTFVRWGTLALIVAALVWLMSRVEARG